MQPVRKTRQPGRGKTTVIVLLMALASILAWYATRLNCLPPLPETRLRRVILIRRKKASWRALRWSPRRGTGLP